VIQIQGINAVALDSSGGGQAADQVEKRKRVRVVP
jgi:hypothetical protein